MVKINAKVDIFDPSGRPAEIRVYEGNLEDSILVRKFAAQNGPVDFEVYVNKKYSVTATYYNNGSSYTAIDATTPGLRLERKRCDYPCYYTIDNLVDLRIRYTK